MRTATGSAFARAALAGNPSDGYGGAVLAVCLRDFAATATVTAGGAGDGGELAQAALRRFARLTGCDDLRVGIEVATTIPREVGLAGSSAIVVAVFRALAALTGAELDPLVLAREALATEAEDLGIGAGPQDRVVQALGGLVAMDFASGHHERLDAALLPELFVAYREDCGETSGVVHGGLRERFAAGERVVVENMRVLAGLARGARDALVGGNRDAFAACIDGSFDVRERMLALDPRDARLVAVAREHGAAANYAGSGGAVVGVLPGAARTKGSDPFVRARELAAAYETEGARFLRPAVG